MLVRPLITLLVCAVIATGCSAQGNDPANESASTPAGPGAAVALDPAVASLPGKIVETTVTASDDLREEPTTYLGAMHEATPSEGEVVIPTRQDAAALITAFDADKNVLARGIAVHLDGFTPNGAVELDYTSTAFTRLLTLPTFVTDDPLGIMILRGAAEQSPALPTLAAAIEANAATNPTFEAEPSPAENKALAALAQDVRSTLANLADDVNPRPAGAARTAPAWAVKAPTVSTADAFDALPCLDVLAPGGGYATYASDTDATCGKAKAGDDGAYTVKFNNEAALWGLIYAHDGSKNGEPRLAAAINPYTFTIPDLSTIISALTKAVVKRQVATVVSVLCAGASLFRQECPEQWVEEFNPSDFFGDIADAFTANKGGEAEIAMTFDEARNDLIVITPGLAAASLSPRNPERYATLNTPTDQAVLGVASMYTSIIEPTLGLILGDAVDDLRATKHRTDGPLPIAKDETGGKHKAEAILSPDTALVKDLIVAMAKSEDLAKSYTAITTTLDTGDLNDVLPALADFSYTVITDRAVLNALTANVLDNAIADVLQAALLKYSVNAVPGIGWAKAAIDIGLPVLNATIGGWNLLTALRRTHDTIYLRAPNPKGADILASYDWESGGYTYDGYSYSPGGEGFSSFRLGDDGATSPALSGVQDTRFVGATYGTVDGEDAALVAIQMVPDGDPEFASTYLCVHLIAVNPETHEPYTKALLIDYPSYDLASRVTYAIEGDQVVTYNTPLTGSMGAKQDDVRVTYKVTTRAEIEAMLNEIATDDDPYNDTDANIGPRDVLEPDQTTYVAPSTGDRAGINWDNTFIPDV